MELTVQEARYLKLQHTQDVERKVRSLFMRSLYAFRLMTNKTGFCGVAKLQHVVVERIQDE